MSTLEDTKEQISICLRHLDSLVINVPQTSSKTWFKELCMTLTNIISMILRQLKTTPDIFQKNNSLQLYFNQLATCLPIFIEIFERESEVGYILLEARRFVKRQTQWCLEGLIEFFREQSRLDDVGSFLKWMDLALDKISEIDCEKQKENAIATCEEAKVLFEEVLSHAMSIAQIALENDCKIIRGSSQSVLDGLDSLNHEMKKSKPNIPMINLFVDICTDKLCALERKVNTAVLKLALKVFSEYTFNIDAIEMFCLNKENRENFSVLDSLVVEFDLHVDRIMQIGLFAVACSTCSRSCAKIRSCLASLEALEAELVPAFMAILLDHSTINSQFAIILRNHWLSEANCLRKLIFLIIDPYAFCQIIYEENKQIVELISEQIKTKSIYLERRNIDKLLKNSNVLHKFTYTILEDGKESRIDKSRETFKNFSAALNELRAACNSLLEKETISKSNNFRIYKRCKILLNCTKLMWHTFMEEIEDEKDNKVTTDGEAIKSNPFLDHIIKRGKDILRDRSILNPNKNTSSIQAATLRKVVEMTGNKKSIPLSKLVHFRKMSFMSPVNKNQDSSLLQITDILNELNNMTDSWGSGV